MGAAASLTNGEPVLLSIEDVRAAHCEDCFKRTVKRHEEVLSNTRFESEVVGYQATAHYAQPLMEAKLDRYLGSVDEVSAAYCQDQKRTLGHVETHLEQLASGGSVNTMCLLHDNANLACASEQGQIWIYNWREGRVVCEFRDQNPDGPEWGGGQREACKVRRLCSVSEDHRLLASSDEHGYVSIWDLYGPSMALEARLHEKACSGLKADMARSSLITTGEDCYIISYDVAQEQVKSRAVPPPLSDGSGVPNLTLEIGGSRYKDLVLAGGADGKIRIWDQAERFERKFTLQVGAVTPTQCLLAPNGWQLLVTASLGDSAFCGMRPERGGLYVYDMRKLSEGSSTGALIKKFPSGNPFAHQSTNSQTSRVNSIASRASSWKSGTQRGSMLSNTARVVEGLGIGALDVVTAQEGGNTLALCLMDNVIKAFDLGSCEETEETEHKATKGVASWEFNPTAGAEESEWATPCSLISNDRYVFVGTTAPALTVWRRGATRIRSGSYTDLDDTQAAPLEMRARCLPLALSPEGFTGEVLAADPSLRPGAALANVQAALAADQRRALAAFQRPGNPTPRHASSGGQWFAESALEGVTA
eukprot:TRINITY_DN61777_c0_g1_i1.p1 TRINITY_DN61777_c0_g1~~TRINITY_DN61777_c0_g1_i1.p1  ORF type:complete len:590 (+),score=107.91 TRINITY_DN61777_c0_g1_i1:32-1801(+)